MEKTSIHIINHTHWDREWFLTSVYTSQWIPGLINKLWELAADNPEFKFFLDGQTLVIEDLLKVSPGHKKKVEKLVRNGNLVIGPYYCQPDWQLTGGEALIRNLYYGWQDVKHLGGHNETGWLVDTFGHISQSPQLHRLFGIESVYVWRGVPQLVPYFDWQGADGQVIFAINLFGGYRNLYGVIHVPEIAIKRLEIEANKLNPYYPTSDIPLFDGYDLEDNPEDPIRFFRQRSTEIPPGLKLRESTPDEFVKFISQKIKEKTTIRGELNSGKFGATFPGALSARTYLKVISRDCEHLLYQVCEPLAVLASLKGRPYITEQYETWGRTLLRNAVHDCVCGVSIDQVHEKMEFKYQRLFDDFKGDIYRSLEYILKDFMPGRYAVSTNPFFYEGWHPLQKMLCRVKTDGVGVWPLEDGIAIETPEKPIEGFTWQNQHYKASLGKEGVVQLSEALLGYLVISQENGDTYSDEIGSRIGICRPTGGIILESKSDLHSVIRFECHLAWENIKIAATVRITFDQSPLIRWQVDLDSRGTDFRVNVVFETALLGSVYAGSPFDIVKRPTIDHDLLPRELEDGLANVLLGQRELETVKTFPFHDFVAISNETSTAVIFAKGVRAYQADEDGKIRITLRRAVEWLTKPDLKFRSGDAGPFFYVPDARCERRVKHELAFMIGEFGVDDATLCQHNASFQNPPLLVETLGGGDQVVWEFLHEDVPLSSLRQHEGNILGRFYNPAGRSRRFHQGYQETDVWGNPKETCTAIPPKRIVTVAIDGRIPAPQDLFKEPEIKILAGSAWRVGENHGLPQVEIIEKIKEKITTLENQLEQTEAALKQATTREQYILQHRVYVLKRELHEYLLSIRLNELKLAMGGKLSREYLYETDDEIAKIGFQLNQFRIKRRIYDYVVQAV